MNTPSMVARRTSTALTRYLSLRPFPPPFPAFLEIFGFGRCRRYARPSINSDPHLGQRPANHLELRQGNALFGKPQILEVGHSCQML